MEKAWTYRALGIPFGLSLAVVGNYVTKQKFISKPMTAILIT